MKSPIETNFYTLSAQNNILCIEIMSAWDERVVDAYHKDLEKIMADCFSQTPWAVYLDLTAWELNTPEAEKKLWDANRNRSNTPTHVAIVVGDSETRQWQMKKMLRQVVNFESKLFTHDAGARQWLSRQGYALT